MNTNTNKNTVNKPEGARRPVNPNQTVEEQKHNAQINNINNNMEDDNMLNNNMNNDVLVVNEEEVEEVIGFDASLYTNKISSEIPEVIKALETEVFAKVYGEEQEDMYQIVTEETEEEQTIYSIYFNALCENINRTLLFALLKERNMMSQGYGQLQFFIQTDKGFQQTMNQNNKPVIHFGDHFIYNKNYFSTVISFNDQKQFTAFYKRFMESKGIKASAVRAYPIDTLNSNNKYQILVLDVDATTKKQLHSELKTSKNVKAAAKIAKVQGGKLTTGLNTIRTDLAPTIVETGTKLATEAVFLGADVAVVAAKTVYKQVGNYVLEKSTNLQHDEGIRIANNNYKEAFNNFKSFFGKKDDENETVYICD